MDIGKGGASRREGRLGGLLNILKRRVTTEISVETTETVSIRRNGPSGVSWCGQCGKDTEMVSLEDAAAIKAVTPQWLAQCIAEGKVHFSAPKQGVILVCLPSLLVLEVPLSRGSQSELQRTTERGRPT